MTKTTFTKVFSFFVFSVFFTFSLKSQTQNLEWLNKAVKDLEFRNIGPSLMGGRIADIEIHPDQRSTWYIAVGSGGLWKTINNGITWKPIFDKQFSYSIGDVCIDPGNPEVIWVGTGENVSGRHVAWGDGVYKSMDGGKSWVNMGLEKSEHIGKILVDPRNSEVVFVAAEGPLWSSGGERGVYRSENGGKTWELTLDIDENTGVTDIEFDPTNPDIIYAASYQRRRHTWSLLAGGPQSGIYKSTDNGLSWRHIKNGLPSGDMGKIGLAVTPANPNLVYATIESDNRNKGFYKSMDKGESWQKENSYTSGGTGPHYYQEIEASPTDPDLVYQMDVFLHVTRDGGKTFDYLGNGREKHSDNHALWIDPQNGQHLIAGTDGGLYESFDDGTTWRHFSNLPIAQFYKIALDNSEPYYNIVAGAQDLGTLIGPSRTMNTEGIANRDWYVPLGADGYDCAFDPEDPNIVYMEIQQGLLYRHDRRTEEGINIQPQPAPNDPPERWNWDSPLLISPHNNERLYFGSQRVWKSEDRGNSWQPISEDLTSNTNRYELELIDKVWSVDDLYDNGAMSKYSTLTSISESTVQEGLIYTGSDDGLIHVTADNGVNWKKAGTMKDVPERSFINDIEASLHDENIVFAVVDAHKFGNYTPFVFLSEDKGKSWQSISGDLPLGTIVWAIKQDHIEKNLLFLGTEYGIYFSPNLGKNWIKLDAEVPTIAFRDIELHPRFNDLVGATFGRGIYVLDDYSPLRIMGSSDELDNTLLPIRDAWWYVPYEPMQAKGMPSQGSAAYAADNPPFGAVFTYYLKDVPTGLKSDRQKREKELKKEGKNVPFPGWEQLEQENNENDPMLLVLISDEQGNEVRWVKGAAKKGLHRITWDLRYPSPDPINLVKPSFVPPWAGESLGPLVAPGKFSAEIFLFHKGSLQSLNKAQSFNVKPIPELDIDQDFMEVNKFRLKTSELSRQISAAILSLAEANDRLRHIKEALLKTPKANEALFKEFESLKVQLVELRKHLNGDRVRSRLNESSSPSISSRVGNVVYGHWNTSQAPTDTQKKNIEIADKAFGEIKTKIISYLAELEAYEEKLEKAGSPWTKGRKLN